MKHIGLVIIGAGPAGLGAGYGCKIAGYTDFLIVDVRSHVGGLASSFCDKQGFWWDIGGHVQFTQSIDYDQLMESLLPGKWVHHTRSSGVWIRDSYIPYPFQHNIHRLPEKTMKACLNGLIAVKHHHSHQNAHNFLEWILSAYGNGIAHQFLIPYNRKIWTYPVETLSTDWVRERVADTDLTRIITAIIDGRDDNVWGPNRTFRYPKSGGTGAIWKSLAQRIGYDQITLNTRVVSINTKKKILTLNTGEQISYGTLISTMPIDILLTMTDLSPTIKNLARGLRHSSVSIVGVGLESKPGPLIADKNWIYYPSTSVPFYRVTHFSRYTPHNVPDASIHWSLMCEISYSTTDSTTRDTLVNQTLSGLRKVRLLNRNDKIVSIWTHNEAYGYPTPGLERNTILDAVLPELQKRDIFSRGRFGYWKYEISNQDHSMLQGFEAALHIICGSKETVIQQQHSTVESEVLRSSSYGIRSGIV